MIPPAAGQQGPTNDATEPRDLPRAAGIVEALKDNRLRLASLRALGPERFHASDLLTDKGMARYRALALLARSKASVQGGGECSGELARGTLPQQAVEALVHDHGDISRILIDFDDALRRVERVPASEVQRQSAANIATFLASFLQTHLDRVVAVLDAAAVPKPNAAQGQPAKTIPPRG